MLEFTIDNDGESVATDSAEAVEFLRQSGIPVSQVGQDGLTAFVEGPDGQVQTAHMADLLSQAGLEVQGIKPANASEEMFNPKYRFLTERLGNDEQKKQLLTMELEQEGIKNPTVIGAGVDWYAFDPRSQRYYALTNKPGLDSGDVMSGIETVGKGALGTMGAVGGIGLGSATGPGAIALGAAGGALGSAAGEGILQGLATSISPAFREVQSIRGALPQLAEEGLWGGGFGALGGTAAMARNVLPGLMETGRGGSGLAKALSAADKADRFLGAGIGSQAARGAGGFTEAAGAIVGQTAGRVADSPLGRSIATSLTPGVGAAQMAGFAAQAPRWLLQGGAKAPGWIGRQMENLAESNPALRELIPQDVARGLQAWSKSAMRRGPARGVQTIEEGLEKANLRARGVSEEEITRRFSEPRTADVLANSLRKAAINLAPADRIEDAARVAQQGGRYVGRGVDAMARVGKGVERVSEDIVGTGLRGVEVLGNTANTIGRAAKNFGTALQPFENRATARILAEEQMPEWLRKTRRSSGLNNPNVSSYPEFAGQ